VNGKHSGPGGGPDGNGGPPGAGGGGGGDPGGGGGPDRFGISSEDGTGHTPPKKLTKGSKNPFDTKDAKDNLPRYDGKVKREFWRKMVGYYLYSKSVDMGPLLKWAEQQVEPITGVSIHEAMKSDEEMAQVEGDPEVLAHHLWGFLNISLVDDAWEIFDSVDVGCGLEVWRLVNIDTTQKTEGELMEMEDLVQNPRKIVKLELISKGIVVWDNLYKEFKEAGGEKLTPAREVNILAKMLPTEFKQHALWEFSKFKQQPAALRAWIKEKVRDLLRAVPDAAKSSAHLLAHPGEDEDSLVLTAEDMENMSKDELIMAFAGGGKKPFFKKKFERPTGPKAPPRDVKDMTCPNCTSAATGRSSAWYSLALCGLSHSNWGKSCP